MGFDASAGSGIVEALLGQASLFGKGDMRDSTFRTLMRMRLNWPCEQWVALVRDVCSGRLALRARLTRMMLH